jgi:hypothetical protein
MKFSTLHSRQMAVLLLIASLALYGINYLIFGDMPAIETGFLGNLAFLPVYVLFVTLMIERVIKEKERLAILQKLNMVIGVFFSEAGTELLRHLTVFLFDPEELKHRMMVSLHWEDSDFQKAAAFLLEYQLKMESRKGDLARLRHFLKGKREVMLRLLENPNLLEHDDFTDLLWAVFHLSQELEARQELTRLPTTDLNHLSADINRAYAYLLREWIVYMQHLKNDYPYLFSLAVRTNPMCREVKAEVV